MQINKMKNIVVLKGIDSNVVEEAIVVLKPNIKFKQREHIRNNSYTIKGFSTATAKQVPTKTLNGELEWETPAACRIEKVFIGDLEHELEPTEEHEIIIPRASDSTIGVVKGSEHIKVENDGSIVLKKVPSSLISDMDSLANRVSTILDLKPIASSDIDSNQLVIRDGVLGIKKVDSGIVQYEDTNVESTLDTMSDRFDALEDEIADIKDDMQWKTY